jgi:uncharacterized protein (DUF433 family)
VLYGLNEKIINRLKSYKGISCYGDQCIVDFGILVSKKDFRTILKLMKKAGARYVEIKKKYSNLSFKLRTVLI